MFGIMPLRNNYSVVFSFPLTPHGIYGQIYFSVADSSPHQKLPIWISKLYILIAFVPQF